MRFARSVPEEVLPYMMPFIWRLPKNWPAKKDCVLVRGTIAPIVGIVSMDVTMVDVTGVNGVSLGDEVTIYGISTNSAAYFGSKEQDRGDKTLKRFSEETGGKPFFPFKVQDLAVSFQDIGEELRSQYTIAYRPSNNKADGTFRKIRIDVADKRYKARSRNGYYAPRATASSQR